MPSTNTVVSHPSAAETTSGQSGGFNVSGASEAIVFFNVTAASGTVPTLDVKVQISADGITWHDEGTTFTQVIVAITPAVKKLTNIGAWIRFVWTVAGTTPSFTFTLTTILKS